MAATARALGHEYMVLTDHSPRLTIAHGLNRERLEQQLADIAELNAGFDDFRILTGMEVDIWEDGSLDLDDDLLERLDVVVASVHSKLRMERHQMTERMVVAVANPHVDILGHCTGRLIGKRPESTFDADYVFAACKQFGTAVEINCRPERLDPPRELIDLAIAYDCVLDHRCPRHRPARVATTRLQPRRRARVPIDKVINTMTAEELLAWTAAGGEPGPLIGTGRRRRLRPRQRSVLRLPHGSVGRDDRARGRRDAACAGARLSRARGPRRRRHRPRHGAVAGTTMLDDLGARPWRMQRHCDMWIDLHRRLRALPVGDLGGRGFPTLRSTARRAASRLPPGQHHADGGRPDGLRLAERRFGPPARTSRWHG